MQESESPMDENAFYHAWHDFKREMDIANGAKVYRNQIIESTLADIWNYTCEDIHSVPIVKLQEFH